MSNDAAKRFEYLFKTGANYDPWKLLLNYVKKLMGEVESQIK